MGCVTEPATQQMANVHKVSERQREENAECVIVGVVSVDLSVSFIVTYACFWFDTFLSGKHFNT